MNESYDLYKELAAVLRTLSEHEIEYALCGGLAVAVHGYARFTEDIDLIILDSDLQRTKEAVKLLGFTIDAGRIPFPKQNLEFYRVTKIAGDQPLAIDFLPVKRDDELWSKRQRFEWEIGSLSVLSVRGIIEMKQKSERERDKNDIAELKQIHGIG